MYEMYKTNRYNSGETSGPSLYDALNRYEKYERKLIDSIRPTDDTLQRLSSGGQSAQNNNNGQNHQQTSSSSFKSSQTNISSNNKITNFTVLPNGNNNSVQNDEESSISSNQVSNMNAVPKSAKNLKHRPISHNPYLRKQLSVNYSNNQRIKSSNQSKFFLKMDFTICYLKVK
jgi:hypothetical protein